jgi:uncharacterized repeat protein (TIGR01451 family)
MTYCLILRKRQLWVALARVSFALLLALGPAPAAPAAERQRVNGGHIPAAAARLAAVGKLPGSQRLSLAIGLPLRNQQELDTLLQQLYDPSSPNYRRYLTPEQFTERFGPTQKDYQALMDFAKSNGLAVTATHPNRVVLSVAADVTDIQRAFHLTMRVYRHPREERDFYAPDVEPSVAFGVPILRISGLDNYSLPHPNFKLRLANATPKSGTGPGGTYLGSDFRTAYVPGTELTGAGQSVGLLQFDGFYASDIASYASQAGLPDIPLTVVPIDGGVSTPGSNNGEVCLDIEMVMSMAPGLTRIYVYEAPNPSPWVDLLSRMANDNLSKQLSCSWGGGSPDATAEEIFKQMAAQGQSFFNATGDSDAFVGAIEFPSDSTNITQVGGTTLTTGTGATYTSETVWNWGLQGSSYVGSSGGISTYYLIPDYQLGINMSANQGSTTMRNVPDVALTADNIYVVYNNGSTGTFGGTSCAAPLWAGFTALVNQQAGAAGRPAVGFLNPAFYTIGRGTNYSSDFRDITTGDNFSSSSPTRFAAVTGYDLCTGWGTPNGTNLINTLVGPPILGPLLVSNSFTLVTEGCTNSVIDPAETVTVNFGLRNIGTANTTNLVATLLATGGIFSPSGPQTYGVLDTNGMVVTQPFSFTSTGNCGDTNVASIQLQDGTADLGTLTCSFRLGQFSTGSILSQDFDGVTAPELPADCITSASGAQSPWVTSTSSNDTAPNSAFSPDPSTVGLNELVSPTVILPVGLAQLTFRHNYDLETTYDGGVLEIKIGGGAWTDTLTAGGDFVSGGYNYTLSSLWSNPLAARQAWSGNSGGFITTVVNLPAVASGQAIQLRWRCGTDNSFSSSGWYVDTVAITSSSYVCCTPSTDLGVSLTASPDPVLAGQPLTYVLTVTNLGPASASSVTLTDALPAGLTFVSASRGCVNLGGEVVCNLGILFSGGASNFTVVVTPAAGGLITNVLTVTSSAPDPDPANNVAAIVTAVDVPPSITTQPDSQAVLPGANVAFQVTAAGTPPLAFQWLLNDTNLEGAVDAVLTLTNVQVGEAGTYTVLVANAFGSVLSSNAVLTVLDPWIIGQPQDLLVKAGALATFTVSAVGTLPLSYQWLKEGTALLVDGGNISGALTPTLTVADVQIMDVGNYSVVVSNLNGHVVSSNAALVAGFPPVILTQPASQNVLAGSPVAFTAGVIGSSPMSFYWQRAGTNLADGGKVSGAATASLLVSNAQAGEMGSYSVVVSNAYGSVTSSNALLSVWPLLGWGRDDYSQADIPSGLTGVTSIAAGFYHSLVLRADGAVAAWGAGMTNSGSMPNYGQSAVPAGLSNVVGIAGGGFHSLVLKADGTVAAWGAGETNADSSPNYGQSVIPDGLSNALAVAAGYYHSLALKADGTVIGWGYNGYGQTNSPGGLTNVVAVASGAYHNLALKADGTVMAWGAGTTNGTFPHFGQAMVPIDLTNVVAVAGGLYHSLALKADGTMVAWGSDNYGQAKVPADLTNAVAVAAGLNRNLALKADGTVVIWGDGSYGTTNIPTGLTNAVKLAGGDHHNLVLEGDGRPHITVQPFGQTAPVGATVRLLGLAVGLQPLSYQWRFNGSNLLGATLSSYTLAAAQPADAGDYLVAVTNAFGAAVSSNAHLIVLVPPAIISISLGGSETSISFPSQAGVNYLLEYTHLLDDPGWTPLPPAVAGTGGMVVLQDTNALTDSRYYRLRSE